MLQIVLVLVFLVAEVKTTCLTSGEYLGNSIVSSENVPNALTQYTLKSYKQLVEDTTNSTKNILTSPYSIWSALSNTYLGSRGASSDELGQVLGLNSYKKADIEYRINALEKMLSHNDKDTFLIANKIAFADYMELKHCIKSDTPFEVEAMNFTNNANGERIRLNAWVANKTNNRIKDLLPEGSVKSNTATVLINAVFFKGNWKVKFDENRTHKATFTASDDSQSQVDMMQTDRKMRNSYDSNLDATGIELEYIDGKFSMVLALPSEDSTVDEFINKLNVSNLNNFMNNMQNSRILVKMPKFMMKEKLTLKSHLEKIGAPKMFKDLDLTGILAHDAPTYITDVFHQSFIEVNEKGSEATAATAVVSGNRVATYGPRVAFNKPFVFFIREINTNAILFMGVVRKL